LSHASISCTDSRASKGKPIGFTTCTTSSNLNVVSKKDGDAASLPGAKDESSICETHCEGNLRNAIG